MHPDPVGILAHAEVLVHERMQRRAGRRAAVRAVVGLPVRALRAAMALVARADVVIVAPARSERARPLD